MNFEIVGDGDAVILVKFSEYTQAAWGCEASVKAVGALAEVSAVPLATGEGRFWTRQRPLRIKATGRWTGQLIIQQRPDAPRGTHARSFHLRGPPKYPNIGEDTHVIISSLGCIVRYSDHGANAAADGLAASPYHLRPLTSPDERYRMTVAGTGAAIIGALMFLVVGATAVGPPFAIVLAPIAAAVVTADLIILISAVRPRGPLQIMGGVESEFIALQGRGRALIEIIMGEAMAHPVFCVVLATNEEGQGRNEYHLNFPSACGPVNASEVKIQERGAWTAQIRWPTHKGYETGGSMIFAWARRAITVSSGNELVARTRGDRDCGATQ